MQIKKEMMVDAIKEKSHLKDCFTVVTEPIIWDELEHPDYVDTTIYPTALFKSKEHRAKFMAELRPFELSVPNSNARPRIGDMLTITFNIAKDAPPKLGNIVEVTRNGKHVSTIRLPHSSK